MHSSANLRGNFVPRGLPESWIDYKPRLAGSLQFWERWSEYALKSRGHLHKKSCGRCKNKDVRTPIYARDRMHECRERWEKSRTVARQKNKKRPFDLVFRYRAVEQGRLNARRVSHPYFSTAMILRKNAVWDLRRCYISFSKEQIRWDTTEYFS